MFELIVAASFSAAHSLRGHKGKCARLHGHNWKVGAGLMANKLNGIGMVIDAGEVKKIVRDFLEKNLDHIYLNELPFFRKNNPTSENIAKYVYNSLKKSLPQLRHVSVSESDSVAVSYSP